VASAANASTTSPVSFASSTALPSKASSVEGCLPRYEARARVSNGVLTATNASKTVRPVARSCAKPTCATGRSRIEIQSRPK
jgi:hypothetical protein